MPCQAFLALTTSVFRREHVGNTKQNASAPDGVGQSASGGQRPGKSVSGNVSDSLAFRE